MSASQIPMAFFLGMVMRPTIFSTKPSMARTCDTIPVELLTLIHVPFLSIIQGMVWSKIQVL